MATTLEIRAKLPLCVYDGPSRFTGRPIRAYLHEHESKTGPVVGLTVAPAHVRTYWEARKTGCDVDVCGTCPHRSKASGGNGTCYVGNGSQVGMGLGHLLGTGHTLPVASDRDVRSVLRGKTLRSAVWGDAGALPIEAWDRIESAASDVLGYTHAWTTSPHLQRSHCASVDTVSECDNAGAAGWSFFHVAEPGTKPRADEIHCPASHERGRKLKCIECRKCARSGIAGAGRPGRMIWRHDTAGANATKRLLGIPLRRKAA